MRIQLILIHDVRFPKDIRDERFIELDCIPPVNTLIDIQDFCDYNAFWDIDSDCEPLAEVKHITLQKDKEGYYYCIIADF